MHTIEKGFKVLMPLLLLMGVFSCSSDDDAADPLPENQDPDIAILTDPGNNTSEVDITDIDMKWQQSTDPDGDAVSYTLYLDINNPPTTKIVENLNTTSYTMEDTLGYSTPFFWRVMASDGKGGTSESTVATFTTREQTSEEKLKGLWVGAYGNGTADPSTGYAFLFRVDGTVRVFNMADTTAASVSKAEGSYTISGNIVKTTYTYIVAKDQYSTEATVNTAYDHMEGTWGNGENTTGGGTFYIDKQ